MTKLRWIVLPGGLSTADHVEIHRLAEKGWKAGRIAQSLQKHPGTVQWFMYCQGLAAPQYGDRKPYMRGSVLVSPFTPDEDAYIEELRGQGLNPRKIALASSERFVVRSGHTIACRLIMLAAREVAAC